MRVGQIVVLKILPPTFCILLLIGGLCFQCGNPAAQRRKFCIASGDLTIQCLKSGIPLGNLLPCLRQIGRCASLPDVESKGVSNRQKNDHLFHDR
nr:hypothetical protein [Acetobacter tropicalis]